MKLDKTGAEIRPFGYELGPDWAPVRRLVKITPGKDHGADPLGDGRFRMVPSGRIVSLAERNAILRGEHEY